MIIVDSDILIWILRGSIDIKEKMTQLIIQNNIQLFITPIQISEIYSGMREKERTNTTLFLDSFPCINIDYYTGKLAGEYMRQYKKSHNVTLSDSLIAACCIQNNLKLWTLNKKHYPMLQKDDFISVFIP
jgi:hypothetical protein